MCALEGGRIAAANVVTANAWMNAPAGFKMVDGQRRRHPDAWACGALCRLHGIVHISRLHRVLPAAPPVFGDTRSGFRTITKLNPCWNSSLPFAFWCP